MKSRQDNEGFLKRRLTLRNLPIALAIVSSLVVTCLIAAQKLSFGSAEGFWRLGHYRSFSIHALLPFFPAVLCVLLMAFLSLRREAKNEKLLIFSWFVIAFCLQLAFRAQLSSTLEEAICSNARTAFYSPTLEYSASEFLSRFESIRPTLALHARSNMPGKVMFFFLLGTVTESPQVMGYLIILFSNLGGILLYFTVKNILSDRRTALFSYILYLFLPCKIYMFPLMNTVSPVLIILCFFLFVNFLRSQKGIWAVLLGLCLYGTMFFDPLPFVMGLTFLAMLVYAFVSGRVKPATLARLAVYTPAAFGAVHLFMIRRFNFDIFHYLNLFMDEAKRFNVGNRPYDIWVKQNLIDFLINAGTGCSILFFVSVLGLFRASRGRDRAEAGASALLSNPAAFFLLSVLAVLTYLEIAGINRGEVIRLWIFLASFWIVGPAYFCAREPGNWPFYSLLFVTLLQTSVSIYMISF